MSDICVHIMPLSSTETPSDDFGFALLLHSPASSLALLTKESAITHEKLSTFLFDKFTCLLDEPRHGFEGTTLSVGNMLTTHVLRVQTPAVGALAAVFER